MRVNLYVHFDSVTSHIMSRGINLMPNDFETKYLPSNMIVETLPEGIGRFDVRTNFKMLRGKQEVLEYFDYCKSQGIRLANWIDFESITMMHQLVPNEIAEILYLFHANQALRSAYFYKLQNNFVYLTLPNGLIKTYYRHFEHFYPRLQRVLREEVEKLINEGKTRFFSKKGVAGPLPLDVAKQLQPLFARGVKFDFAQAYQDLDQWVIPLFIIEDELTLLTINQSVHEQIGFLTYHTQNQTWRAYIEA